MMKFSSLIRPWALLVCLVILIAACAPKRDIKHGQFVEFSSEQTVILMTLFGADDDSALVGPPESTERFAEYLGNFEMLSVASDDPELGFNYFYYPKDGNTLDLRVEENLLYVNDVLRSITIDDEVAFVDWVAAATERELQSLRSVFCDFELTESREAINRIIQANPSVMLMLEEISLTEIELSNLKPVMVGVEEGLPNFSESGPDAYDLSESRVLMLDDCSVETLAPWRGVSMPKLEQIWFCDSFLTGKITVADFIDYWEFREVHEESGEAWPGFESPLEFHSLLLDVAPDLNLWPNPHTIRQLEFDGSWSEVRGAELLESLEVLNPGVVTDEELRSIVSMFPGLIHLDLASSKITTLEPLSGLEHLQGLSLGELPEGVVYDFAPLSKLEKLRYVWLPEAVAEDAEVLDRLKVACPNCLISIHGKFCLGAGWLVLFLPPFLLVMWLKRLQRVPR
jgi:hypothetical protein